jgi:hypothetical protein
MIPAIVIAAYDRPQSLRRLLCSLSALEGQALPGQIPLVISLDGSHPDELYQIAEDFRWPHGKKSIRSHSRHFGLREHIISCGDLTAEFDSIILLEDDLFVSPHFYHYAKAAAEFYASDPSIAGIALYSHHLNETASQDFCPIHDGSDVFFMQLPCSWGQLWTKPQWSNFKEWHLQSADKYGSSYCARYSDLLPANIRLWPESSWKKLMAAYMVARNLFVVYPRISLSTNFADDGVHCRDRGTIYQVPLLRRPMAFRFVPLAQSGAVYDVHEELLPRLVVEYCPRLAPYDFDVDLYGTKLCCHLRKPFTLTTKSVASAIMSFGMQLKPHEWNIFQGIPDTQISLAKVEDLREESNIALFEKHAYYSGPHASAALKELSTILEQRDSELSQRDATLKERDATLKERDATLKERDAMLKHCEATIRAEQARERELSKRVGRLEHELTSMKGSRSWKITAPLRRVSNLLINLRFRLFDR